MESRRNQFDIAVIGGGPAGTSAAITAANFGAKVGLFESGDFPRHKVCGEFVSAESIDVLRELLQNTAEAESVLQTAPVIDQTRLFLATHVIRARVMPPALSMPRYTLDSLLWQAAKQAGVEARSSCEVRSVQGSGPFYLDSAAGEVRASSVIVAAGRWSKFKATMAVPDRPKWIGVKAHYCEDSPPRSTDLYFFEHGYCGVQPVAEDVVNACAMVRSDRATSLEQVLTLHPALAERRRNWQTIMEPATTAPLIFITPQPIRDNKIFVGDAAAFIDPFVGDGISIALRTGRLAAMGLEKYLDGACSLTSALAGYEQDYAQQFFPLINAASRIRSVLSWPESARTLAFQFLRLPGVMPYVIRRTRRVA
jgi:flavin-dependent dehydrogenase